MSVPEPQHAIAGRYLLLSQVAAGGMATVHLGRVLGAAGFSKVVAIKRLHPHLAKEPEFVAMFLDEARLAARVRHANVVPTLDVVEEDGEVFLIMEYVLGASLAQLLRAANASAPPDVAAAIIAATLHGLHAAHEARADDGSPLGIVHRDVSPQNIIVGADGAVRVVDFGIAKATGRAQITRDGELKGKASYMPPEQIRGRRLDRRADVYAAGVVCWELLTGRRLFSADEPMAVMLRVCEEKPPPPSRYASDVPPELDAVVARALAKSADGRFSTAQEFADAIERALPIASARGVARWVDNVAAPEIAVRARAMDTVARTPSLTAEVIDGTPTDPDENSDAYVETGGLETETTSVRDKLARRPGRLAAALLAAVLAVIIGALALQRATVDGGITPATAASPSDTSQVLTAPAANATTSAPPIEISLDPEPAASGAPKRLRPAAARNCNPPWVLAPDGIKVLKPECR